MKTELKEKFKRECVSQRHYAHRGHVNTINLSPDEVVEWFFKEFSPSLRWVKASGPPIGKENHARLHIKHKGVPDILIWVTGRWYWWLGNIHKSLAYPVDKETWSDIEWLDESTTTEATSLEQELAELDKEFDADNQSANTHPEVYENYKYQQQRILEKYGKAKTEASDAVEVAEYVGSFGDKYSSEQKNFLYNGIIDFLKSINNKTL